MFYLKYFNLIIAKQLSDRYERLNDLMIHFISKIEMTSLHYA